MAKTQRIKPTVAEIAQNLRLIADEQHADDADAVEPRGDFPPLGSYFDDFLHQGAATAVRYS